MNGKDVPRKPVETYQSYLVRCWMCAPNEPSQPAAHRFVVERVGEAAHRWGFNSLADLVVFLQTRLSDEG